MQNESFLSFFSYGREEIRTPGSKKNSQTQARHIKPLCHTSSKNSISQYVYIYNYRHGTRTHNGRNQCFYRAPPLPVRNICIIYIYLDHDSNTVLRIFSSTLQPHKLSRYIMETVRFELTSAILQRYYNTNYTISP